MFKSLLKFIKGGIIATLVVIVASVAFIIYSSGALLAPNTDSTGKPHDKDAIIVVGRDGTEVIHDKGMRDILEKTERAAKKWAESQPSQEDREARFLRIWGEIRSHMVDPAPGTYPVKFFGPEEVPLNVGDDPYRIRPPAWIDNDHIVYWGLGDGAPPSVERYSLVLLEASTGKIVKVFARSGMENWLCFDEETRNFAFSLPDKSSAKNKPINYYGQLGREFEFNEVANTLDHPSLFSHRITCSSYKDGQYAKTPLRPEDGHILIDHKDKGWDGDFILTRSDGSQTSFSVKTAKSPSFQYDRVRKQYFISLESTEQKQERDFIYFDRNFNLVESFDLPRVDLLQYYPAPFISIPSKDGFILGCNLAQHDEESISAPYLCHAKKDRTVIGVLAGAVSNLAVSPDGCRVFGFWKQYESDKPWTGKNFVADICPKNNNEQGEVK